MDYIIYELHMALENFHAFTVIIWLYVLGVIQVSEAPEINGH